ncbi:MAG: hypothetical protein IKW99_05625 [Bacteroidales bacterium]|nr:hypothetical protein [Bacteroidales bacterium]
MKDHPSLVFPDEVTPRLNGVLSYCRFKEIQTRANLLYAEKSLKEKGVPYVLAGDMAMRGYFPDYQRWIAGLGILVPASEHDTALAALSSMVNDKQVNIHKAWDNGVISRANGQLPCPEDLVFMALVSVYETIIRKGSLNNNPSLVLDINSLADLSEGLGHGLIWDNACLSGTEFQILFAEAVVGSVSRGVFAEEWPESSLSEKQLEKHFVDFLFKRDVIYGTKEHASSSRRLWISALTAGSNFGIVPSVMKKYLWNRYTLRHK